MVHNIQHALAYLFYAVAATDRRIEDIEIEIMTKTVHDNWPTEDERKVTAMFEGILQQKLPAQEAFDHFDQYFQAHKDEFDTRLRHTIFRTADAIASSFAAKNKSELVLLSRLGFLFQ